MKKLLYFIPIIGSFFIEKDKFVLSNRFLSNAKFYQFIWYLILLSLLLSIKFY